MVQKVYTVTQLPESALIASAVFHRDHLDPARRLIGQGADESLAIVLPPAPSDHADWRRALARDLARACAPVRVNVVAGEEAGPRAALLSYVEGAKGVTGHYLEAHE